MTGRIAIALALALTAAVTATAASAEGLFGGLFGKRGEARQAAPAGVDDPRAALAAAYPGAFRSEGSTLVFADGTRVIWDDGREKSAETLLTDADVEDMFHYPYPAGAGARTPARDEDPGRVRSEPFFRALYGDTEQTVRAKLVRVPWFGGAMTVTTRFGVHRALGRVRDTLAKQPALREVLTPPGGGFLWRPIAGTDRLSVHSFGAAVDVNTAFSNYWLWEKVSGPIPYRNKIPLEVVTAFEAECFIWGGRWYHYDTMHFEYRPELLPGCRRGDQ